MSIDEEKKTFVIKHIFTDVENMENNEESLGNKENHFNVPWRIRMFKCSSNFYANFSCMKFSEDDDWSIDTTIDIKILTNTGSETITKNRVFSRTTGRHESFISDGKYDKYLVDGNFTVECNVTINKMSGIKGICRKFDESMEKFSNFVVKVKDQKFYLNKIYLATHSTYFEALFMRVFDKPNQSEIELKDINQWDFQNFLEVIYGEPIIDEDNIEGILHLADMYDAKTAIRQCEDFLVHKSKQDLKFKLEAAVKHRMEKLKKKCISEIKTVEDIKRVMPEDVTHFDKETLGDLLKLAISFDQK